jgi:enoyl-CoA hydratase
MWLYHVGPQWTKRLLLTGDTIDGDTAASIGFAQAAVPPETLDPEVATLAARMALVGRDVLVANKRVVNAGLELMGRSLLQRFAGLNDAVAHLAPEARAFAERSRAVGLRQAVSELNAPFA